jgi:hypothetical protein
MAARLSKGWRLGRHKRLKESYLYSSRNYPSTFIGRDWETNFAFPVVRQVEVAEPVMSGSRHAAKLYGKQTPEITGMMGGGQ